MARYVVIFTCKSKHSLSMSEYISVVPRCVYGVVRSLSGAHRRQQRHECITSITATAASSVYAILNGVY